MKKTSIIIILGVFLLSGCLTGELIVGGVMFHAPVLSLLLSEPNGHKNGNGNGHKNGNGNGKSVYEAKDAKIAAKVEPPKPVEEKPISTIEIAKIYDLNRGFEGLDQLKAELESLNNRVIKAEGELSELKGLGYVPMPKTETVVTAPAEPKSAVMDKLVLSDQAGTVFEINSSKLTKKTKKRIDSFAATLKGKKISSVVVAGHTDSRGSEKFNMELGKKRAEAVAKQLSGKGIDRNLITAKSFGPSMPIADNKTLAGRKRNRRVEISVYK
jgi:outer membrane protein OmpA-like peptidoglycan-associated protein